MNIKIVCFFHTYARDGEFGTFINGLIKGFEENGVSLYIFKVNDLVEKLSDRNYINGNVEDYVLKTIYDIDPDFIFTTNWGGINQKIMQHFASIPRVTWMVDRNPFMHNNKKNHQAFDENDIVITSSTSNIARLEKDYPQIKGNVYFFPFMTSPESFDHTKQKNINISFIGSLFSNTEKLIKLLTEHSNPDFRVSVFNYIKKVEENYELDIEDELKRLNLYNKIHMEPKAFHGIVANIISNNKRIKALDKIASLGLEFYGTKNWINTIIYSTELVSRFQLETFIKTREELCDIYDRSKISININHHQATTGQGYRVFDILASSSLLITNYQENSDLEKIFGKDHPIPTYKTLDELYDLCHYYLHHEKERVEIVQQCNRLIGNKHTFKTRAKEIIHLVIPNFKPSTSQPYKKTTFIHIPPFLVHSPTTIKDLSKMVIKHYLGKTKALIKKVIR